MDTQEPSVAAFDVGYGNLKVMATRPGTETVDSFVMPVGAVPIPQAPRRVDGQTDLCGGYAVRLPPHNAEWAAGIDPTLLQGFNRHVHAGYPKTDEYLAIYYAGLARLAKRGHTHISHLVTGVPCSQFVQPNSLAFRRELAGRMRGTHTISPNTTVRVDKVYVIAQPMGAYGALRKEGAVLPNGEPVRVSDHQQVLVIDAGFFSVDYVLVVRDSMRAGSAGSSNEATSEILKAAVQAISAANGGVPLTYQKLESVFRRGDPALHIGAVSVPYRAYIDEAAGVKAKSALAEVCSAMNVVKDVIDIVLLAGGGAPLFEVAARKAFHPSPVVIARDPVMANVRGYLALAERAGALQESARAQTVAA